MDSDSVRSDFPTVRRGDGIYLDSACQALRPDSVIRAITEYYEEYPGCGGRSVHSMATRVSVMMDEAREALARFFGTDDPECYVFTGNTTEGLNTAAYGLGLKRGDVVVTTDTEHNSNHVPWLRLRDAVGIERRMSRSGEDGTFDIESFKSCMDGRVKVVSVQHASNVTGAIVPVKEVAEIAHDRGATVVIDGAQAAPHMPVDLEDIGADIYCLSVHKMLGPSGMGVMYGRREVLERVAPLSIGGGTVGLTTYDSADLAPIPDRFEAGLHDYAGIAGTKAALEYLSGIGMGEVQQWDRRLMRRIFSDLEDVRNLRVVGPSDPDLRGSVFSFNIDGLGAYDIGMMLDSMAGVMIRSGMHCVHSFYKDRGIEGSARASTYLYNNEREIDVFADTVRKISETFGDRRVLRDLRLSAPSEDERSAVPGVREPFDPVARDPDNVASDLRDVPAARQEPAPVQDDAVRRGRFESVQDGRYGSGQVLGHSLLFGLVRARHRSDGGRQHDRSAHAEDGTGQGELHHADTLSPNIPSMTAHSAVTVRSPDTETDPRTPTGMLSRYTLPRSSPPISTLIAWGSSPPISMLSFPDSDTSTETTVPRPSFQALPRASFTISAWSSAPAVSMPSSTESIRDMIIGAMAQITAMDTAIFTGMLSRPLSSLFKGPP